MSIQNWFHFEHGASGVQALPQPYNTLSSCKLDGVKSQYTNSTTTTRNVDYCTLSYPPIQAVHDIILSRYAWSNNYPYESGIGKNSQYAFAQVKVNDEDYRIAAYSFSNGLILLGKYNSITDTYEQVATDEPDKYSSTAIFMALFYNAMSDGEFINNFTAIEAGYNSTTGFEDRQVEMGTLCDNLYRRLKEQGKSYSILVNSSIQSLTRTHITARRFEPDEQYGSVNILTGETDDDVTTSSTANTSTVLDFAGKYKNPTRILTPEESLLVPEVKSHIVVHSFIKTVCEHIRMSFNNPIKMSNVMFRGIAGTGKTTAAKLVAAGLGLPYGNVTCSADTQIFDLLGSIIPDVSESSGNSEVDAERQKYIDAGGINYNTVSKFMNFPDVNTIAFDPVTAYQMISGVNKADATAEECMSFIMQKVIEKTKELCASKNGNVGYKYVETPLVKAIKYGWVCEIQEPTVILQQGVLVGLNSLLEQDGTINLPTGEVVKRHPDAVIILTTNIDYEGCRAMNQSVSDRMNLIFDIPNPNVESMKKIAMQATGCTDEATVRKMAQVVLAIEDYCKNKYITDGSVGQRGLIDWVNSYMITGDVKQSAKLTVLSKATTNETERDAIETSCVNPTF